ncbi:MAG: hypothetical protein IH935_07235, partial [Acidobacteria bacterium]|nr:hypothetical protein [Acidobacteriota bacterium]
RNLQRSRVGRAFMAVRDNDLSAALIGIHLFKYKLLAFFTSSFCITSRFRSRIRESAELPATLTSGGSRFIHNAMLRLD